MKEQLHSGISRSKKIQILTMAPPNWSRIQVAEFFDVGESVVRSARSIESTNGICSLPPPRKGKTLLLDVTDEVTRFFESEENTRIMPGMSNQVGIKKNTYKQKQLLLCTLRELHALFKNSHPEIKIGVSKFCTLRPKWCVSAGSSGVHSVCVCVCTIHQNVVLLLHAARLEESYKDLIKLAVCDHTKADCMLMRCDQCPGVYSIESYLKSKFEDLEDDIEAKQWVSVDRTDLVTQKYVVRDFISILVTKFANLIPHHFISNSQTSYLRHIKDNLDDETAIILMDFSENYSFRIQDEAQGYHWNHNSCTVHPSVCYFQKDGLLDHKSLCFISKDLQHDVPMVYLMQKYTIEYLKQLLPNLKMVEYFSDGCAAQYKNFKSFWNLCYHKEDFDVDAKWSFFATSHGKSSCDGIGGVVKRNTSIESLRRPLDNQITNVENMIEYCNSKLTAIYFKELEVDEMQETRRLQEERFTNATTIKGTRGFHFFQPVGQDGHMELGMKRISFDENFSLVTKIGNQPSRTLVQAEHAVGTFVCANYDRKWYVSMVLECDAANGDVLLKFMHPNGDIHPRSFNWPSSPDICWIPTEHIICNIDVSLSPTWKEKIDAAWISFLHQSLG